MTETKSYAYHSIAAAYGLAFIPQYYAVGRMMPVLGEEFSFAMPQTNMESFKRKVSTRVWEQCYRARCAHINALEGFPLFAVAMVAGQLSSLPAKDLNQAAGAYLGLRVLHSVLYVSIESSKLALLRTGVWGLGVAVPIGLLWKAGGAV